MERIKRDVIAQGQVLWAKEANSDQSRTQRDAEVGPLV